MSQREDGPPLPVVAMRDAIPTAKHAMALFDLVVGLLGDRACVQSNGGRERRSLFVRVADDPALVVPWPLLSVGFSEDAANEEREREADAPFLPPPDLHEPGTPYVLNFADFHPVAGDARLHDGPQQLCVNYGANGRWKDTVMPADPTAFATLVAALARGTAHRLELLAEYAASLDVGRHGPARVRCPVPRPGGFEGVYLAGRTAIREALFTGRVPPRACWAVADGHVGSVVAFGPTREAALGAWSQEVERARPQPPTRPDRSAFPPPTDSFEPTSWEGGETPSGAVFLSVRGWDAPPLDPSPAATPAVIVPIAALPAGVPPEGDFTRWLGDRGATNVAVRVHTAEGYVLVGDGLRPHFDPASVDGTLLAADRVHARHAPAPPTASPSGTAYTTSVTVYRCREEITNALGAPRPYQWQFTPAFPAGGFDGDTLNWALVRVNSIA